MNPAESGGGAVKQSATKKLHSWGDEKLSPLEQKISDRISDDVDDNTPHPGDWYQIPSKGCIRDIISLVRYYSVSA